MRNSPVHWSDGMFLRPHHFQASDQYWSEVVRSHAMVDHPVGYGLYRASISTEGLLNGILEITGLQARWKSGELILQDDNHIERVDLKLRITEASGTAPIRVFLAIPAEQMGQANVALTEAEVQCRYREFRRLRDDESRGGNRQEIAMKQLNYRILLSTEDTHGYDLLPLCQVRRSAAGDGQIQLDRDYFPPSISLSGWSELASIVRAIYDLIGSRIQSLSEQIRDKGMTLSSQTQGDLEKVLLLHALNEAFGELSVIAFAPGIHPLVAYTSLCSIVGRFSLFGSSMTIGEVPRYQHDDLAPIFRWALDMIRKLIFSVKEDEYEQRYFVGRGRGLQVALESEWFGAEWDWYFGVNPIGMKPDECLTLLKRHIDWKLGSSEQVERLFEQRAQGVIIRPLTQSPRALPSRGNWVYFQIVRENEAWKHVQLTQTLAMRVKAEQIANLDRIEGTRRLMLSIAGNVYALEFAVFAVRKRV